MINMQNVKTPINTREPGERTKDFKEVTLGYTAEQAKSEAERCLNCKNAKCVEKCPVGINIPLFIKKLADGDVKGAYDVIKEKSCLSAVCGRVCPQETQCESVCARGVKGEPVGIGRLERYVSDYMRENGKCEEEETEKSEKNGVKVAVVGSGPSGLSCAGELVSLGYEVTVFEALHKVGGVLVYGIPEFRLPKDIVKSETDKLEKSGVVFKTDCVIGKTFTIDELFDNGYKAVYVASGAGLPKFMNIKGENLNGVYSANEFLTRINLMGAYKEDASTPVIKGKKVAVIGGGNVAMDAVRSALRLGAEKAMIVYRRSTAELPARKEETEHAKEEGVEFITLTNPKEIIGNDDFCVTGIRAVKTKLGEPDERGRRKPVDIADSEHVIDCDVVIMALGTSPNPLIKNTTPGLEVSSFGGIIADAYGQTTQKGVFAGGDAVTGSATVITAMGSGKTSAHAIDEYIRKSL